MDDTNPKDLIGAKKPRLSLVSPAGLLYEALAMADGAEKYGPYNWREKKVQAMIYIEACMRHLLSWQDGEENSQDRGIPHLGHAKACLGILIDAQVNGCLIDNRPIAGCMGNLIETHTKKEDATLPRNCCGDCEPTKPCICDSVCLGIRNTVPDTGGSLAF